MSDFPIISVMISIYNSGKYLERCIDSVINQSLKEIEIILIDDGSTDTSRDICDRYAQKDNRIKVIHKQNGGLASARIAGIACARGEWFGFVDSDDWIDSQMYRKLYDCVNKISDIDIVTGGYVEEKGDHIRCVFSEGKEKIMDSQEALLNMFEGKEYNWSLCDKLYRRVLFSEDILSKWPHSYGEDTFINWHVFMKSRKIIYTPVYGYHYCMNDESMTHKGVSVEKFDYFRIYDYVIRETEKLHFKEVKNKVIDQAIYACLPIIFYAEEDYAEYEEMITSGLKQIEKYIWHLQGKEKTEQEERIQLLYKRVALSYEEIIERNMLRDERMKTFAGDGVVYIYGTGKIAEDTTILAQRLGIKICGYIISNAEHKPDQYFGRAVFSLDEILKAGIDYKIMLAMNEKNASEVIKRIGENEHLSYIDAGAYNFFY